ncbi:MAG: glycosyltransferase [Patescibacteria group bacterium]
MSKTLTVSIVIPAKNEERYLPILLYGLSKQTHKPEQIILADADSTDKTREIALKHGCIIVQGGMPGPGRNAGAQVATGDILLFLDADVQIDDPKFIEHALEEIEEKQLDIATPDIHLVKGTWADKLGHGFYNLYVRAWGTWRPHAPGFCIFIRRSLFEKIKGFDASILLCEDHELAQRAGKQGKFGFLNSISIGVTDRRLRRDGGLVVAAKYVFAELHTLTLGPIRHNLFHYDFGYDEDKRA